MTSPAFIANAGGGRNQGLASGLALSLITGRPARFSQLVNEGLPSEPGLGHGGVTAPLSAGIVSGGKFEGGPGRQELLFEPNVLRAGDYDFDVAHKHPNPGPISLVIQTLALPLARLDRPSALFLAGGTQVPMGLMSDEMAHVMAPNWRALGVPVQYTEVSPGFLPKAKGEAEVILGPGGANPLPVQAEERFRPVSFGVEVLISGLPLHLGEQALDGALGRLELFGVQAESRLRKARGGVGMTLLIWAQGETLRVGFNALGRRGGRPGELGIKAAEALRSFMETGAGISAEALTPLMTALACANGVSRLTVDRLSPTLKAAIGAVEAFWPGTVRLDEPRSGQPVQMRVVGHNPGLGL